MVNYVPKNNSFRKFAHEGYWPVVVSTRRNCNMLSPPGSIMGVLNRIGEGRLEGELLPCNVRGWGSTAAPRKLLFTKQLSLCKDPFHNN